MLVLLLLNICLLLRSLIYYVLLFCCCCCCFDFLFKFEVPYIFGVFSCIGLVIFIIVICCYCAWILLLLSLYYLWLFYIMYACCSNIHFILILFSNSILIYHTSRHIVNFSKTLFYGIAKYLIHILTLIYLYLFFIFDEMVFKDHVSRYTDRVGHVCCKRIKGNVIGLIKFHLIHLGDKCRLLSFIECFNDSDNYCLNVNHYLRIYLCFGLLLIFCVLFFSSCLKYLYHVVYYLFRGAYICCYIIINYIIIVIDAKVSRHTDEIGDVCCKSRKVNKIGLIQLHLTYSVVKYSMFSSIELFLNVECNYILFKNHHCLESTNLCCILLLIFYSLFLLEYNLLFHSYLKYLYHVYYHCISLMRILCRHCLLCRKSGCFSILVKRKDLVILSMQNSQ